MFTTDGFRFFASALMGLSAVTCGTLLLGGWRQRQRQLAGPAGGEPTAAAPAPFALARSPFASGDLDVAAELRHVLVHMAAQAGCHLVQLEFAAQPDLTVHADRLALHAVLSELVGSAMHHAPCGRVLLSAIRLGGRVQIAVIDDGDGPAAAVQEAALRDMAQLVALQGGTIDVESRRGEGTTVLVRLPEPMGTASTPETRKPLPAERFAAPSADALEAAVEHSWEI
jgi:hypothetical protein